MKNDLPPAYTIFFTTATIATNICAFFFETINIDVVINIKQLQHLSHMQLHKA